MNIKGYVIVLRGDRQSEEGWAVLKASHETVGNEFALERFDATTPETVGEEMKKRGIEWTYPWDEETELAGLRLHPYTTSNRKARIACFMSHYRLWEMAAHGPILILEDDALFIKRLDPDPLLDTPFNIIGINDPRGATRLASLFHERVTQFKADVCGVPWVDEVQVPQGLAGASAYLINTDGAGDAIDMTHTHGAWPNDALLSRQLVPRLGQTRTYFTKVQGTRSTLA